MLAPRLPLVHFGLKHLRLDGFIVLGNLLKIIAQFQFDDWLFVVGHSCPQGRKTKQPIARFFRQDCITAWNVAAKHHVTISLLFRKINRVKRAMFFGRKNLLQLVAKKCWQLGGKVLPRPICCTLGHFPLPAGNIVVRQRLKRWLQRQGSGSRPSIY